MFFSLLDVDGSECWRWRGSWSAIVYANVRFPDVFGSNYVVLALVDHKSRRKLSLSDSKTDSELVQLSLFFSGVGSGMVRLVMHSTILSQSKDQIVIDE